MNVYSNMAKLCSHNPFLFLVPGILSMSFLYFTFLCVIFSCNFSSLVEAILQDHATVLSGSDQRSADQHGDVSITNLYDEPWLV